MKLHFTNGPNAGDSFELTPPEVTIGRETDNSIPLLVDGVSRYHSKLEYKDNCWTIEDLGSTNGTIVNKKKLTEPCDLFGSEVIIIGNQKFKLENPNLVKPTGNGGTMVMNSLDLEKLLAEDDLEDTIEEPAPVAFQPSPNANIFQPIAETTPNIFQSANTENEKMQEEPEEKPQTVVLTPPPNVEEAKPNKVKQAKKEQQKENVDFFGSAQAKKKDSKQKSILFNIIFYLAVFGLAAIAILMFLQTEKMNSNSDAVAVVKKEPPLLIHYVKQVTTADNIFRYSMLVENTEIKLTLDDLKYSRHIDQPKTITEEQLDRLKLEIRNTDFINQTKIETGATDGHNDDTRSIMLSIDGAVNEVVVKNNYAPNSFSEVENIIEHLSVTELEVKSVTLTPEEMQTEAEESFNIAQDKFENYEANPMNLTMAIKRYKMTMEYLAPFTNKPDFYAVARDNMKEAEKLLDNKYNNLFFNGNKAFTLGNYTEAKSYMHKALSMFEESDKRYERARNAITKIESKMRRNKVK